MDEEKAAAYYDEISRKGGAAARFKQGLGFSSETADTRLERGSALASSSSFLSSFVRASKAEDKAEKQSQLQSIHNKLKKRDPGTIVPHSEGRSKEREREREKSRDRGRESERERDRRRRSRSRERKRSRSRSWERERDRYRGSRRERRKRSRPRSLSDDDRKRGQERERGRKRDKSSSPRYQRSEMERRDGKKREERSVKKKKNGVVDYAKLIEGYNQMTPAEKVKAKMKLQLSETAGKDTKMGSGSGWERFDFEKDAPLDGNDDEEIEGADDDAAVVKRLGQSFRFSNIEARREEEVKAAHDEAMFGAPVAIPPSVTLESEQEDCLNQKIETVTDDPAANLISEKVLTKQQGSWRDRARRNP